jgi:hypothetical protein
LVVALAAMVLFRESALLNAACDRIARRRSPFWVSEGTVMLMNILLHFFKTGRVVFGHRRVFTSCGRGGSENHI